MVIDYSGKLLQNNQELKNLADAIRAKNGLKDSMTVAQMTSRINSLPNLIIDSSYVNNLDSAEEAKSAMINAANASFQDWQDLNLLAQEVRTKLSLPGTRTLSIAQMAYLINNSAVEDTSQYSYYFQAVATNKTETSDRYVISCYTPNFNGVQMGDFWTIVLPEDGSDFADYCQTEQTFILNNRSIHLRVTNINHRPYWTNSEYGYELYGQDVIEGDIQIIGAEAEKYSILFKGYDGDPEINGTEALTAVLNIELGVTTDNDLTQTIRTDEENLGNYKTTVYINYAVDMGTSIDYTGTLTSYELVLETSTLAGAEIRIGDSSTLTFEVNGTDCELQLFTESRIIQTEEGIDYTVIIITGNLTVPSSLQGSTFYLSNWELDEISLGTTITI